MANPCEDVIQRKKSCEPNCEENINNKVHRMYVKPPEYTRTTRTTCCQLFWNYMKAHKAFLLFVLMGFMLFFVYMFDKLPCSYEIPKKIAQTSWNEYPLRKYDLQKPEPTYIQGHDLMYEQMLKQLRQMQQAATNLQKKQQAIDRKTQALERQLTVLTSSSPSKAGYLNEAQTKNMIKEALRVHEADKLDLRDHALESAGGSIISTPSTRPYLTETRYVLFSPFSYRVYSNPRSLIQPEIQPGKCFAFYGKQGRIRIKLAEPIFILAVSLEHAPLNLLTNKELSSAPKQFQILGLNETDSASGVLLGEYTFDINGPSLQTNHIIKPKVISSFQYVELYILSNYGNPDYTCVYRFRVHGRPLQGCSESIK